MKTLAELLHDEMVRNGYFGANGRDDEAIAGLIGAVQEWLSQGEFIIQTDLSRTTQMAMVCEAGRDFDA